MHSFKRFLLLSVSTLGLLVGAALPAIASAANSSDGTLKVYVDVDDHYYHGSNYDPSDFSVDVYGDDVSRDSFHGSSNGTTVYVDGWYSVTISNLRGYEPSYSSGCYGYLDRHDSRSCRITLSSGSYNNSHYGTYYPGYNYNYNNTWQQYSYYPQPTCGGCQQYTTTYAQPCGCQTTQPTVVSTYIPALPNTGFEPINKTALAFSLALLSVLALLAFPYVRKTLTAYVR